MEILETSHAFLWEAKQENKKNLNVDSFEMHTDPKNVPLSCCSCLLLQ